MEKEKGVDMEISKKKGLIFNIQRYSLNDGSGIRTIVFFKGCPLRCPWCSNPESQKMEIEEMKSNVNKDIKIVGKWYTVDEVIKEDVDTYPIFKGVCDTATTKPTQKECFEKTFAALFEERLRKDPYEVSEPIKDSVILNIKVDNIGKIVLIDIKADEKTKKLLSTENESFEDSLRANLSMLSDNDAIAPATKNGQNVSTQFELPIKINVK